MMKHRGVREMFLTPYGMTPDGLTHGPSGNELGRAVNQRQTFPTPRATGMDAAGADMSRSLVKAARFYPTPRTTGLNGGPGGRHMIRKLLADGQITREEAIAMAETVHVTLTADDIPSVSTPTDATPTIASLLGIPEMRPPMRPTPILPTPASRDYRSPNSKPYAERGGGKKGEQLPNAVGGSLNPTWVEWLMGFPPGWTLCMVGFRKSRPSRVSRKTSPPASAGSPA